MTEASRSYHHDKMPGVLPRSKKLWASVSEDHDDHVKSWRLIERAKANLWTPALFARKQCEEWGIPMDRIQGRYGGREIEEIRFVFMNRLHQAYPHLSSTQIGRIFRKNHSTVLYILGRQEKKPAMLKRQAC
jgi:chromosomal replication initiation ATPase DnaA